MADSEHELRSFGRRRGRKGSASQSALLHDLLPQVAIDLSAPPPAAEHLWLEIGFGGGEHLVWQARRHPDAMLIGCEPYEDGVVKVLRVIGSERISNVRLHMGDARDVLRWLPAASLERVAILFPDPWPKRKHKKRRLVNASLLVMLANAMKSGAELRVATDIGDYARTMLEVFAERSEFNWTAEGPSDWRTRPDDWPETRYEAKAASAGRRRYYFRFLRT
jgi:tRNA (guanine-N7-)-methyltransferase